MKTKIIFSIIVIILAFSLLPMIKAEDVNQSLYDNLNIIGQISYLNSKGFFLFTTQGTVRHCGFNQPEKCSGNPIWCGQPDDIIEKPSGYVLRGSEILSGSCSSPRNKGAFANIYYYNGYFLEKEITSSSSFTLSDGAAIEIYCCECYTPCARSCTHGEKEQYVCSGTSKISYSYCCVGDNGCPSSGWKDITEDCPSGKKCIQPSGQSASCKTSECTPGQKDCASSTVKRTCSSSGNWVNENCLSGQTCSNGVCSNNPPPGPGECIGEEESFNSKGSIFYKDAFGSTIKGAFEDYKSTVNQLLPLVMNNYKDNKDTACCKNLTASYSEEKSGSWTGTEWWDVLGLHPVKVEYSYSIYKCKSSGPGFCIEGLANLINKVTKSDNCQSNTIYGFVAIALILVIFMALLRGGK